MTQAVDLNFQFDRSLKEIFTDPIVINKKVFIEENLKKLKAVILDKKNDVTSTIEIYYDSKNILQVKIYFGE